DIELENFDTSFDIATISLEAITEVTKADLKRVRGKVNPDITVDPTIVDINDIPDFLSDGKNSLDVLNPQIRLDVTNTSPVTAYVGADIIASYPDGSTETISIGSNLGQAHKKDITIIGNGISRLCLRTSDETIDGYTPVVVEDLPRLLRTIPEKIEFTNININVDDEEAVTFDLGDGAEYSFKTDYEAIVPLQFGPDMELHYSTKADGWDTDLDSYNFGTVHLSMDVDNQTPLGMTPEIYAVDENNEKINDVTCTFTPADNSIKANGVSTISADLKSNAGNLGRMKSIQIEFTAKTGAEGAGKTLNANQTLTLRNIKVSIRGGLTVDLNEL
ncbi:MAG: hypothetical protein K2H14_08455, partial [Muribaculaceae bacterium]|nr:hypothetical protein [Muribaculaceae bacterium]